MIYRLFLLLVAFFLSYQPYSFSYGPYSLTAPTAIDGDTIRADVRVWPGLIADVSIRVIGVDTPEVEQSKCADEKGRGIAARNFTNTWLATRSPVVINTVRLDKYAGRVDAVVLGANGELLSAALIKSGHGRPYNGGARQPWCL